MYNLLILYNPYYQQDVIKQHLEILLDKGQVAFGKVESKLKKDSSQAFEPSEIQSKALQEIYQSVSTLNPLQLFLSDYANLFVAKAIKVSKEADNALIPPYYFQKGLQVEDYFIISDLRELVREDFTLLRDKFLANFTTANNHTYAIYGNNYVYPLIVKQKEEINYFTDETKHYLSVYKNSQYLQIQANFIQFVFGKRLFYTLHPDSICNLISAEIELQANLENPLYDFTSIVVKYSKTLEYEIYDFTRKLLEILLLKDKGILSIGYSVQGREYSLEDFFTNRPNIGTIKLILRNSYIQELLDTECMRFVRYELCRGLDDFIKIRNQAVHEKTPSLKQIAKVRDVVLGIETPSILKGLLKEKLKLQKG